MSVGRLDSNHISRMKAKFFRIFFCDESNLGIFRGITHYNEHHINVQTCKTCCEFNKNDRADTTIILTAPLEDQITYAVFV